MLEGRYYGHLSFCLVLSAHALRSGPSLDFALEGEGALDAVALHHSLAVAGVVPERRYFDLVHAESPPHPEEVSLDRGPVLDNPFSPRQQAVHDPHVPDHFLESELADALFAAGDAAIAGGVEDPGEGRVQARCAPRHQRQSPGRNLRVAL